MRRQFLVFSLCMAVLLLATIAVQAQMRACTQMWCVEGYTLRLEGQDWPAGQYTFNIIADNTVYSCQGALPFDGCGKPAITCNDDGVQIGESGCALPASEHKFDSIMLPKIPDNVSMSIAAPDGNIFSYENAVQKRCGYPNGEECDTRACCSAMESVQVRW